ncbi:hypothetical protein FIE12Z_10460 [Fusarium flagelliforme]|uniref:Uncharacterized protein n=1 Tax=Fusarium flagelliforme TaxID=2675880 RepID=A0A395MBS9_9HYPO|nr:hypothetical protein FIE12Z_10460 [Fusarium flagelliforme]
MKRKGAEELKRYMTDEDWLPYLNQSQTRLYKHLSCNGRTRPILHFAGWLIAITIFTSIPNKITAQETSQEDPRSSRRRFRRQIRKGGDAEHLTAGLRLPKRPLPRLPASLIHLLVPVRPRVPAALSSHAPIAGYSRQRKRNGSPSPSVKAIAASSRLKNSHLSRKRKKGGLNMPSEKAQRLNNSTRKSQKTQTRLPENIEDTSSVYEDSTFDPTTEEFDQLTSPSHRISGHSGLSDSESETVDLSIIEVSSDDTSNSDMDTHHEGSVTHDIADTDANPDTELDADPDDDLDADTNVHSDASSVQEQDDVFNWQQAFQTMARDCQQTNKMMSEAMANRRKDERFQANMTTFSTTAQAQINDLKKDGKAKDSRMDKFQKILKQLGPQPNQARRKPAK